MLYVDGQSMLTELLRPAGDFLRRNDGAFIRSARLGLEGRIYEDFLFKFEYDFYGDINANTEVSGIQSAYVGMENIPFVGEIRIGHMKEPFSLEELDSMNDITFLERSLPNVFAPAYSWGICMNNSWLDERMTFAVGAFRNSTSSGSMVSGNEWCTTTRLTGLPWYEGQGKLMHLGAAYSYRVPESGGWANTNERIRFRQKPELWTRDYIVNTGNFEINSENRLGAEAAFVYGPFSIQTEVMGDWINSPRDQQSTRGNLYGGYAYISYILTGEHREYSTSCGEFRSVTPKSIFSLRDRTWGAWEVAARCSYLNLDDKNLGISGGSVFDTTLGLNWYLNPNMRLMLNWVHADRAGYGAIDGIQTRAQWDFQ
jgi:phosphate-selective porin OprO/OprP